MKRVICMGLIAALTALFAGHGLAAPEAPRADALLRALYEQNGQLCFSPLSLEMALSMALEGAQGETREQILAMPGVAALLKNGAGSYPELKAANAAIVSEKIKLLEAFEQALRDKHGAEVIPMSADVVAQVNAWCDEHTDGMIKQLLSERPADTLRLILLNALVLDAKWQVPFDDYSTGDDTFHAPDGDVTVPFMHASRPLTYAEAEGAQVVKLPYLNGDLEMIVILPKEGELLKVLSLIEGQGLSWIKDYRQAGEVQLALPKLSMESSLSLKDILTAMGFDAPFGDGADFSGITQDQELYIDQILQKARLDVDEEGTRAAAVTGMMLAGKGLVIDAVRMVVDRPFIALVRGVEKGETLFAAVVDNPSVRVEDSAD